MKLTVQYEFSRAFFSSLPPPSKCRRVPLASPHFSRYATGQALIRLNRYRVTVGLTLSVPPCISLSEMFAPRMDVEVWLLITAADCARCCHDDIN